jgi:suppressor for copper-sensitivity B
LPRERAFAVGFPFRSDRHDYGRIPVREFEMHLPIVVAGRTLFRGICLVAVAALSMAAGAVAQDGAAPPGLDLGLGQPFGGLGGTGDRVSVSAKVVGNASGGGTLHVSATVKPGFHVYSLGQPKTSAGAGPKETRIKLTGKGYKLAGEFVARTKPVIKIDDKAWIGLELQEHYGTVTWVAPVAFDAGVNPEATSVEGEIEGQACDEGSCQDFKIAFTAKYEKPSATPGEITIQNAKITGELGVAAAAPGDKVPLRLTITPSDGRHAYELVSLPPDEKALGNKPTLIAIKAPIGYKVQPVTAGSPAVQGDGLKHYEGPVTFSSLVEVPSSAKPGETQIISGIMGFQVCSKTACDPHTAVRFDLSLPIKAASESGTVAAVFETATYGEAAEEVKKNVVPPLDAKMLFTVIGASLLGGLILNLMPCVLPVIGLKILSFVEQAHHDRKQVLTLNLWYSAGLVLVFLALATLSVVLNKGWGEQFTSTWFNVALSGLVFAMALSFLGVWEIPIPGFVGSGRTGDLAQKEGAGGAFAKGILTTILATPCSGPFLGFVFGFTLNQPAYVVYTVFASIGLGMASPYLLIGVFPQLIRFLPKPGVWMETFKQAMGFVLLGTVVFLFTFIDKNYLVPTFAILMAIWVGCWWIGRVPLTAEIGKKTAGWATGILLMVVLGGGAFAALRPAEPVLPWQGFTVAAVEDAKKGGKIVMIDFTADWCLTCKTNLKLAVDTKKTLAVVNKYDVVPFLADWTKPSDEIKSTLHSLGSNSIPVLAIYPAGQPDKPIVLRDLLTQQDVIDALEKAGAMAKAETPASTAAANDGNSQTESATTLAVQQ